MQVREFDLRTLDKMLPCPFCGGEAELDTAQGYRAINGHFGNRVVVYCRDCGADQGTCIEDVPDIHPNEVIERWNKRSASDAQAERVRVLESALKPFAEAIEWEEAEGNFGPVFMIDAPTQSFRDDVELRFVAWWGKDEELESADTFCTLGDLRRAARVLKGAA
jgi:hypothetical protein